MAKFASALDIKHVGNEPTLKEGCTETDLAKAMNWYNYVCTSDQAKEFVITYLKSIKFDKNDLKKVSSAKLPNYVGWLCRILSQGGHLPEGYEDRVMKQVYAAVEKSIPVVVEEAPEEPKVVISIQERVREKTSDLIGDLESQLDIFYDTGKLAFDPVGWMRQNDIKPAIAQKIAEYYKPLYAELYDAVQGKDKELVQAYSHWKKAQLKTYLEIVKGFISAAEARANVVRAARKPRKKKEKPASVLVSKLKYLAEDKELALKSIKPAELIGAQQVWVYNTKYRTLSVYNAIGPAGLSVKGTSLTGYDEKTSVTKRLRKPTEQLQALQSAGKVALRKFVENIKTKPIEASGRINNDTILLRAGK